MWRTSSAELRLVLPGLIANFLTSYSSFEVNRLRVELSGGVRDGQFDQTPSSLEPLLSWQHNENCLNCRDADEDPRFYQDGSPSVFLTVHQAKNSTESAEYLENIRSKYVEGKWPPSSIVYKKKFWKSALELQKAYPELSSPP
eukprot:symbB.v1.2.014837.t1/scaffold1085.1/size139158/11